MPLRSVPFPPELVRGIPSHQEVLAHTAHGLSGSRWQEAIADAALPAPTGLLATQGTFELDRKSILTFAEGEISGETALQLLYMSLAWGLGFKGFRMGLKMKGIGETGAEKSGRLLSLAWTAVRDGESPQACYEVLLNPQGRPKIKQLGAAFATKFLYFAGGHSPTTTPILDAVVAKALQPYAWGSNTPTTAWHSKTYGTYSDLMTRWATEASAATDCPVRADQIEMMLFQLRGSRSPVAS